MQSFHAIIMSRLANRYFIALMLTGIFLFCGAALMVLSCKKSDTAPVPTGSEVQMGAILDLSGDYSEEGRNGKAAIELALADLNALHQEAGSGDRFTVSYTDTHLDTAKTLQAARDFYNQGIRWLVAGPNNSAGVYAIKAFVNQNQMISLGCFSSSPALAVSGDNIFRLITDDNVQGRALVRMLYYDSVKALVVAWRDDTYGNGLYQMVKERFALTGGIVYDGVHYRNDASDFSGMVQQLKGVVDQAVAVHGAAKTGVLLISYQEAVGFLNASASQQSLGTVKWYGCDANAQKSSVTSDLLATGFASAVRFLAPIMAIGTAEGLPPPAADLSARIQEKTGSAPDTYALSAYDAVMIFGTCFDLVRRYDVGVVKAALPEVCAAYNGLGIRRTLNDAGDLASANYIFWTVDHTSGDAEWTPYCTWFADGDYILKKN